jgi:hypothetical protein
VIACDASLYLIHEAMGVTSIDQALVPSDLQCYPAYVPSDLWCHQAAAASDFWFFLAMSPEEDGEKSGRPVEMDDLAGFARRLSSVIVFPPLRRRSVPFSPVHWLGGKIAEF